MSPAATLGILFDLLVGFAIWVGLINLGWKIIQVVTKKPGKRNQYKVCLAAAVLGVLGASNSIIREFKEASKPRIVIAEPDRVRIKEIIQQVMQDSTSLTQELKTEFRLIIKKYARDQEDINQTKNIFSGLSLRFQKLFYRDALLTFQNGKPVKSIEREKVENELISSGLGTQKRIEQNVIMLANIAARESVDTENGKIYMDENRINSILSNLQGAENRIDDLFDFKK